MFRMTREELDTEIQTTEIVLKAVRDYLSQPMPQPPVPFNRDDYILEQRRRGITERAARRTADALQDYCIKVWPENSKMRLSALRKRQETAALLKTTEAGLERLKRLREQME